MKGLLILTVGVAAGFAIAHQVSKTPEGQKFFADIDKKAKDFSDAVVQSYKAREAELRETVEGVVSDIGSRARSAAQ